MADIPSVPINPMNWYWIVGGSNTQVYSSKLGDYVPVTDPTYLAWKTPARQPAVVATEAELGAYLAASQVRPVTAGVLSGYTDKQATDLTTAVISKLFFNLENRVRVLEARPPVTAAQYKTFIQGLM